MALDGRARDGEDAEAEARADARRRLDKRDGKDGPWVPLHDLRTGALFETREGGVVALKHEDT